MIQISNLTKSFGARTLFQDINWHISHRCVGLIGPNGAGKSTLMKILAGVDHADSGEIHSPRGSTVGYLPQEVGHLEGENVVDVVLQGRRDLLDMAAELERLASAIDAEPDPDALLRLNERQGHLQSAYEIAGGYTLEPRAREVLGALGFKQPDLVRHPDTFSGGWRMRILLARLLLQSPDLLLLDEPTNHLDIDSMRWLESFLTSYRGIILMVSHDRAFLNRTIDAVAVLAPEGVDIYPGNYDNFLRKQEEELELLTKQAEQQTKEIARSQAFIDRFKAKASKAKQAQSRLKQLEKVERITLPNARKKVRFRFPEAPKSGNLIVELRNLHKSYGENVVYKGLDFKAYRGQRIALVGPNGAGKSTLLKIIAGVIPFERGDRLLGDRVTVGYFAQHQVEVLNLNNTVIQEIMDTGVSNITQARAALGAFLFNNESIDKPVRVLSGGEKNRLALAKILLNPPNLLVMDEPTNHLDMDSRDALHQALREYQGCLIFISHDRHFINQLVNAVVHVEHGVVSPYLGTYDEYFSKRQAELAPPPAALPTKAAPSSKASSNAKASPAAPSNPAFVVPSNPKERRRILSDLRSRRTDALRPLKKRVDQKEKEISSLEARLASFDAEMADPKTYSDGAKFTQLSCDRSMLARKLEALMESWSQDQQELEALSSEFDTFEAALREES
jgi:ATP-binding cassette, subfamily F, member 3